VGPTYRRPREREAGSRLGRAAGWAGWAVAGRGEGREWAAGRVWGLFFFFSFFFFKSFSNCFQTFLNPIYSQNFPAFSPIILRIFTNIFKTFKITPQPKLMHFNKMHKHLIESNNLNVV
jgi:hypothetical protein